MSAASSPLPMFPGIAGKRVLVTGASSGLGLHFAKVLADQGAHVTLAARRTARVTDLAQGITATGGRAEALELDVSSAASVRNALGSLEVDILINNAGMTVSQSALDHDEDALDRIIDTNLKGVFRVAQVAADGMKARDRGGCILNVASILGHRVIGHASAYAASKAGVLHLTRSLALEWARYGIRVNAICPGYIETDINRDFFQTDPGRALIKRIPQRRLGQPGDLDGALLLLVSDLGHAMTGTDITVDGGHLVSSM